MMTEDLLDLILAGLAGAAAGVLFFGGLWLTVRRARTSGRSAGFLAASFLLRAATVLAVFWLAWEGSPARLGACLLGFVAARSAAVRLAGPMRRTGGRPHAS